MISKRVIQHKVYYIDIQQFYRKILSTCISSKTFLSTLKRAHVIWNLKYTDYSEYIVLDTFLGKQITCCYTVPLHHVARSRYPGSSLSGGVPQTRDENQGQSERSTSGCTLQVGRHELKPIIQWSFIAGKTCIDHVNMIFFLFLNSIY